MSLNDVVYGVQCRVVSQKYTCSALYTLCSKKYAVCSRVVSGGEQRRTGNRIAKLARRGLRPAKGESVSYFLDRLIIFATNVFFTIFILQYLFPASKRGIR